MVDDDYLRLVGVVSFALLGEWLRRRTRVAMRHQARWRSIPGWVCTVAAYGAALTIAGGFVDQVGEDIHVEPGTILGHMSNSWSAMSSARGARHGAMRAAVVRVPHGTFFTDPVTGPITVSYRVGRFSGRVYPLSVISGEAQ